MKNKRLLSVLISSLMCLLLVLSGCSSKQAGNPSSTSDEVTPSVAPVSGETDTSNTESETQPTAEVTETVTRPDSGDSNQGAHQNSGSVSNSNTSGGNRKPQTNTSSGAVADAGPSDTAKHCTITVGSKGYVKDVGDTITYTFYLTTPKKIEDVQAALTYDSRMLRLKTSEAQDFFPVMGSSVIYNTAIKDTVKFNAVNISGFDFTQRGALITAEFEVLRNGGTSISTAIEIMSEKGGNYYVDSFIISDAITCEEILTQ